MGAQELQVNLNKICVSVGKKLIRGKFNTRYYYIDEVKISSGYLLCNTGIERTKNYLRNEIILKSNLDWFSRSYMVHMSISSSALTRI